MNSLDLAVIGNCGFGALIDDKARIVWSCMPRFDSDPAFCALLAGADPQTGVFAIELIDLERSEQNYRQNSAVLETRLYDQHGGAIEIIDYAPRFWQFERMFRPVIVVRRIRPLSGLPRVRVTLDPRYHYGKDKPETTRGSNHARYVMPEFTLRLTTDGPLSYILAGIPFVCSAPIAMILGPDEAIQAPLGGIGREWLERTDSYWREWARSLSVPLEWQDAVIRAAITLKLCSSEDSGAIVAALTTSLPEAPDSGRNWDYRLCWLRDAYFVVGALNRLGATRTMEKYLDYISNLAATAKDGYLQPVFSVLGERDLEESAVDSLPGYRGMGPVRIGNGAYRQNQNDGYGAVILACSQCFFDQRLFHTGDEGLFHRLEQLGEQAARLWDQPDAGLWEFRRTTAVHTHSSVMCWVACDRLSRIAGHLGLNVRRDHWAKQAETIREGIIARAWNAEINAFVARHGSTEMDASLLLMHTLGFLAPDDPRFTSTLERVESELRRGDFLFRYAVSDDFGKPTHAFLACTFWYIDALAAVGRKQEARQLFESMLERRNPLGLLSEDADVATGELWGNFPQTYSMVGIIQSAMRLSRPWDEAF